MNVTSAEALNWSTVALLSPWMCIPCSVAVRLAISSGPAVPSVSLLALMFTVLKSRAASWVRNGNPWMVTSGLPDRPSDDWIWLAIWFSVIAVAARSADHEHHDDHDQGDERPSPAAPPPPGRRLVALSRRGIPGPPEPWSLRPLRTGGWSCCPWYCPALILGGLVSLPGGYPWPGG